MLKLCQRLVTNPSNQTAQDHFVGSLRELLEAIHDIQTVLSHEIDVPYTEEEEVVGSSPAHSPRSSAQERMLQRNIERHRKQSQYIGGLRTAASKHEERPKDSRPTSRATDIQVGNYGDVCTYISPTFCTHHVIHFLS